MGRAFNTAQRGAFSLFATIMIILLVFSFLTLTLGVLICYIWSGTLIRPDLTVPIVPSIIFLISLLILLLGYFFSVKRVSNNVIYFKPTRNATMNIRDLSRYRRLDYFNQKKEVADLIKKEFIEGAQTMVATLKGRPIHIQTHEWIVENVINSPEVKKLYKIDCKICGKAVTAHNILLLVNWSYIRRHEAEFMKYVLDPRDCYKITLIAKTQRK